MKINFNDTIKKNKIKTNKDKIIIDNNNNKYNNDYIIVNLNCYFEKDYYKEVIEVCNQENMELGELLNEALGMYILFISMDDEDEHQKKLEYLWQNFNK